MSVRNYAILYPRLRTRTATAGGGNSLLAAGQHALDGPEHLHLDSYVKATRGGEETFLDHGATGAAETIDPADANWHAITLDANCGLTIADARNDTGNSIVVEVAQDGVGGWTLTLSGNVVNASDVEAAQDTTASTTSFLVLIQRDATNWYGFWAGGSGGAGVTYGTPAIVLGTAVAAGSIDEAIRRDATILAFDATSPSTQALGDSAAVGVAAVAARRDHKHAMPANPVTVAAVSALGYVGPLLISDSPSTPLVFADLLQNEDQDDLIYQDL